MLHKKCTLKFQQRYIVFSWICRVTISLLASVGTQPGLWGGFRFGPPATTFPLNQWLYRAGPFRDTSPKCKRPPNAASTFPAPDPITWPTCHWSKQDWHPWDRGVSSGQSVRLQGKGIVWRTKNKSQSLCGRGEGWRRDGIPNSGFQQISALAEGQFPQ